MLTFKNEDARGVVAKNLGHAAGEAVKNLDFQPFADLEQAVKDDVALLKKTPVVADGITVTGWVRRTCGAARIMLTSPAGECAERREGQGHQCVRSV